jgi:hypothetical protein
MDMKNTFHTEFVRMFLISCMQNLAPTIVVAIKLKGKADFARSPYCSSTFYKKELFEQALHTF